MKVEGTMHLYTEGGNLYQQGKVLVRSVGMCFNEAGELGWRNAFIENNAWRVFER